MRKIKRYFKGVAEEAHRVRWPSKALLWNSVAIVCSVTIVAALGLVFCDFITAQILKSFDAAFPKESATSSNVAAAVNYVVGLIGR